MIKFSRAGWNNVIIFSAMLFILLINISNKKLFDQPEQANSNTLLQANETIVALNIKNKVQIERVGRQWRISSPLINQQGLSQMMHSWQQLSCEPALVNIEPISQNKQAVAINLFLANDSNYQLQLLALDNELLVANLTNQQLLACPLPLYRQLLPFEIY